MGTRRIVFLLIFLIAVSGLYYFSQNGAEKAEHKKKIFSDSIPAPERPKITTAPDTVHKPAGEDYAPGTAMVRASILSAEISDNRPAVVSVKVTEVLGYGPSTPPISTGTELSFDISNLVKNKPEYQSLIREGTEIKGLLSYRQGIKMGEHDGSQNWSLVEIKQ